MMIMNIDDDYVDDDNSAAKAIKINAGMPLP